MSAKRTEIVVAVFAAALLAGPARAADPEHHHHDAGHEPAHHGTPAAAAGQAAELKLADARLVDQDGRAHGFRNDVIGQKIVVMDFVYTTCTTVCPVLSALLAQVQERLGERAGAEVALVSLTVDPVRDTPSRLKEYAGRYGAGPGWTWLTGPKASVDSVLRSVGAYTPNFVDHPALVLVGDGRSGKWTRYYGFPDPAQILAKVNELQAARARAVTARTD